MKRTEEISGKLLTVVQTPGRWKYLTIDRTNRRLSRCPPTATSPEWTDYIDSFGITPGHVLSSGFVARRGVTQYPDVWHVSGARVVYLNPAIMSPETVDITHR